MDLPAAVAQWVEHGYAFLPGYLTADEVAAAQSTLPRLFPTVDEFHDDVDPERNAIYREGQQTGIVAFPYIGEELGLLATHPKLVALAEAILETDDVRLYGCEAWAKYSGAVDYEQDLHRDLVGHTTLVASSEPRYRQIEMFVYLSDVTEAHGPTRYVSKTLTKHLPLVPRSQSRTEAPALYEAEAFCPGPPGTVVTWSVDTFHRASAMTGSRLARYTLQANFRSGAAEWMSRAGWAYSSNAEEWNRFVERASVRQLRLFGFPPPGDRYWTAETLTGMSERYPNFDARPWRAAT